RPRAPTPGPPHDGNREGRKGIGDSIGSPSALVAQRIEHRPPEPGAGVRVAPRAPTGRCSAPEPCRLAGAGVRVAPRALSAGASTGPCRLAGAQVRILSR